MQKYQFHISLMAVHPPPTNVTAVQSGVTSLIVSWAAANGSTGYMIFYNSSGGHTGNVTVEDENTTSYNLTGLYNGQIYSASVSSILHYLQSIRVYANRVGLSKFTNDCVTEVDITLICSSRCSNPQQYSICIHWNICYNHHQFPSRFKHTVFHTEVGERYFSWVL